MTAGRPSPYRPEYAAQARKLCRNGLTDREVADILGISPRTFYRWRGEHDEFAEAVAIGKDRADERVESALYQRAVGYDYESAKIFHSAGAKDPVIVPFTVHVPADVRAALQWLGCRRPKIWSAGAESADDDDFGERLRQAFERTEEHRRNRQAEEAIRFDQAVATGVAAALAARGLC